MSSAQVKFDLSGLIHRQSPYTSRPDLSTELRPPVDVRDPDRKIDFAESSYLASGAGGDKRVPTLLALSLLRSRVTLREATGLMVVANSPSHRFAANDIAKQWSRLSKSRDIRSTALNL